MVKNTLKQLEKDYVIPKYKIINTSELKEEFSKNKQELNDLKDVVLSKELMTMEMLSRIEKSSNKTRKLSQIKIIFIVVLIIILLTTNTQYDSMIVNALLSLVVS